MVNVESLPAGGTRFSTAEGSIEVTSPSRHLVVNRFRGLAQTSLAAPVLTELSRSIHASSIGLCVMNDADGLTDYESGFRQQWTEWIRVNRRHLKAFHLLHSSSVIRIGVKLANVIVGDVIKSYPDRVAFEAAIEEFRTRPPG